VLIGLNTENYRDS